MIDTSSITALITAFRAEVAQNSISPEKVGGILQQIVDALSKAASNGDVVDFLALQERLQALNNNIHIIDTRHIRPQPHLPHTHHL